MVVDTTQISNVNDIKQHPLQTPWILSYDYQHITDQTTAEKWLKGINEACEVDTLEKVKGMIQTIHKVTKWPLRSNIHFFRKGIKPAWEDLFNRNGKKIVFSLDCKFEHDGTTLISGKTNDASDFIQSLWEETIVFVVSEQIKGSIINGCVYSPRSNYFKISLWLKNVDVGGEKIYGEIFDNFKKVLNCDGKYSIQDLMK